MELSDLMNRIKELEAELSLARSSVNTYIADFEKREAELKAVYEAAKARAVELEAQVAAHVSRWENFMADLRKHIG